MNKLPTEHEEQVQYFDRVYLYSHKFPELKCISASQNGVHAADGRHIMNQKRAGLMPGYPDILVDVPRRGYHGARIELKRRDGGKGLSENQVEWFKRLSDQGYFCHQANGWEDAFAVTCWYLQIKVI